MHSRAWVHSRVAAALSHEDKGFYFLSAKDSVGEKVSDILTLSTGVLSAVLITTERLMDASVH